MRAFGYLLRSSAAFFAALLGSIPVYCSSGFFSKSGRKFRDCPEPRSRTFIFGFFSASWAILFMTNIFDGFSFMLLDKKGRY